MGFTATLTEIFGLPTSLDMETQRLVDERNLLAQLAKKSDAQEREQIAINDKLARLGFLFEDREPLYQDFLRAWHDVRYADRAAAYACTHRGPPAGDEDADPTAHDTGGAAMIYVKRNPALIPEKVLKVAERAQQELEALTAKYERKEFIGKKSHVWRAFARYLGKMSYGKCWYSESNDPQSFFDVDHFRPKKEAKRC